MNLRLSSLRAMFIHRGAGRLAAAAAAALALAGAGMGSALAAPGDAASAPDVASVSYANGGQVTVRPGQSLNDVAIAVTQSHDKATLARASRALFDANPNAFMSHDPSRLRLGAVLTVPVLDASGALAASAAGVATAASAAAPASTSNAAPATDAASAAAQVNAAAASAASAAARAATRPRLLFRRRPVRPLRQARWRLAARLHRRRSRDRRRRHCRPATPMSGPVRFSPRLARPLKAHPRLVRERLRRRPPRSRHRNRVRRCRACSNCSR